MATTIKHRIEGDESSEAMFGERDHLEYGFQVTFPELVFESLSGKTPTSAQLGLFNLILNLSFDHGPNSPSAKATITAAKERKPMGEAVAAGIAQINDRHGGAIEPAMNFFYKIKDDGYQPINLVREYLDGGIIIGGYGHRVYKDADPRAQLILDALRKIDENESFVHIALDVEKAIQEHKQSHLPLNIDGAIAVVLCTWGWEPRWSKSVFIIARAAGLCAHYINNS